MSDYSAIGPVPTASEAPAVPTQDDRKILSWIKQFGVGVWQDVKHDLRSERQVRIGLWSLVSIWTVGLSSILMYFLVSSGNGVESSHANVCTGGSFNLDPFNSNIWHATGFFDIGIGFGELSFTVAKVMDICWDVIVGRLGQTVMAYLAWRSFAYHFTVSLESRPVTYKTFWTIYLNKGPSRTSILTLAQNTFSVGGSTRIAFVFIVVSATLVLAFPTLASAMTGYQQNDSPVIADRDGNFVPFTNFQFATWIIHDGQRVNLTSDFIVTRPNTYDVPPLLPDSNPTCYEDFTENCSTLFNVSFYVRSYGRYGTNNTVSTFRGQSLPAPVLNISGPYSYSGVYDPIYDESITREQALWTVSDQVYNYTWMLQNGHCQPTGTYKWGFAFKQLFIVMLLLLIWTIGTYLLWLRAYLTMRDSGRLDISGEYKATLHLASVMQEQISEEQLSKPERELRSCIQKSLHGGSISYPSVICREPYSFRKGVKRWFATEKWWFSAASLSGVLLAILWLANFVLIFWLALVFVGFVFALSVGTTFRSRVFLVLCFSIVGAVVTVPIR